MSKNQDDRNVKYCISCKILRVLSALRVKKPFKGKIFGFFGVLIMRERVS